jgi:DNA-directed RNA polymerase I subunit RPA49
LVRLRDLSNALSWFAASFASAEPGAEIPFTCYYKSDAAAASRDDIDFADQDILVAGQNQHVAFWTRHHAHELDAGHARYIVGLRSRKNNTLTLRDAPVHVVTREVKRLRPDSEDSKAASEKAVQRASLAHAFGTKKSLKAVRARERNQVNVGSMVGVLEVMNQGVGGRTETLPTTGAYSRLILESSCSLWCRRRTRDLR